MTCRTSGTLTSTPISNRISTPTNNPTIVTRDPHPRIYPGKGGHEGCAEPEGEFDVKLADLLKRHSELELGGARASRV